VIECERSLETPPQACSGDELPTNSSSQFEVLRKTIKPAEARNSVIKLNEQLTGIKVSAFTIHANLTTDGWYNGEDAIECW
jgi:hypothetical protein